MANENLLGRLKVLSFLLKYGHDLFESSNFSDTAINAVNNSCSLLNFKTSSLFLLSDGKAELIAQFGSPETNPYSCLAVEQKHFVETHEFSPKPKSFEKELSAEMAKNNGVYLAVSLPSPKRFKDSDFFFVWLIGYENNIPEFAEKTAEIIANHMADALYFQKFARDGKWAKVQYHAKKRWWWIAVFFILTASMFCRVSEKTNAEFTLKAPEVTAAYAWFDGPLAKCMRQDGDFVVKGNTIVVYESEQLRYRLDMAKSALRETETELAVEEQNAFTDPAKLAQVELLKAKCHSQRIAVDEAQWYMDHAEIRAPASGILALNDGRAELLAGKAVRTGDKIFEILGGDGVVAEIFVNERDASVLYRDMKIDLYLYNAPEEKIPVTIVNVSHYPELTEQRTYCYKIRVTLPNDKADLRLGMRGIAKISGPDVFLGYYLFKSLMLYLRGV